MISVDPAYIHHDDVRGTRDRRRGVRRTHGDYRRYLREQLL
jgi:hypothetical protein